MELIKLNKRADIYVWKSNIDIMEKMISLYNIIENKDSTEAIELETQIVHNLPKGYGLVD